MTAPDGGSAVVDFALVSALLTVLFMAVVQVAVVLHVRNSLVDCAGEGARHAALADGSLAGGIDVTRRLIAADLSPAYAVDVTAGRARHDGLETVVVRVRAPLPVLGLLGVGRMLTVEGHANGEPP